MLSCYKYKLINRVIRLSAQRDYRFFRDNLTRVKDVQAAILKRILYANRDSLLGKRLGFGRIRHTGEFRKAVPLMDYEDYLPFINKQKFPGDRILTSEKIILFEPTGGTSGGSKFIPYTRSLQREFRGGINTWLYDLYRQLPGLSAGQSYWSISPVVSHNMQMETTVPVGFASDAEYLGLFSTVIEKAFAVPGRVKNCTDYANFRYLTALHLLGAEYLTLISVWNPTFLLLLLDFMKQHWTSLVRDLYQGTCTFPVPLSPREEVGFIPAIPGQKQIRRARELDRMQQKAGCSLWTAVWPRLSLVSCWLDGESSPYAADMEQLFPGVYIQAKGLLATEGIVSLPLVQAGGAVPAYTSHFLEFLAEGETKPCLITDIEPGVSYQVIITTGGGLYRYNLKDRIIVKTFYRGLPVITFTGRKGVSDVAGEKLDFCHIKQVLDTALQESAINPAFLFFAPEKENCSAHYILFLEPAGVIPVQESLTGLAAAIDEGLKKNFHYYYARELGQLGDVEICLTGKPHSGLECYYRGCLARGMKAGDIKPVTVSSRPGWKQFFRDGGKLESGKSTVRDF